MSALALKPVVTPGDRLELTFCVAIIVHTMLVLGVGFAPEPPSKARFEGLEVTLVSQVSETPPDKPDLLAQANLRGGGDTDASVRPTAPITAPMPAPQPEVAAAAAPPQAQRSAVERPVPKAPAPPAPPQEEPQQAPAPSKSAATLTRPEKAAALPDAPPQAKPELAAEAAAPAPADIPAPAVDTPPLPTATQLITRSFALASLNSELQQKLETRAKRPRLKFISANTQEYKYAAYMEAWRAKVERIGNLNYPDEARQRKLSGSLLLDVALRPDGSVVEIIVRRSSGHKVLDDAAVRIVELAAPYAEFPDEIVQEVDILHVTRTWKFLNTAEFAAQ